MGKVWLIASGKGGVGKSMLTAALGIALTRRERSVCIIDADIGLRDQDAILGLENNVVYDIVDVANKNCRLEQALISPEQYPQLKLLPASQFARVKEMDAKALRKIVDRLKGMFDDVLIDCPAGIERGLRVLLRSGIDACVLVCTPDDVCIRDVERTFSVLEKKELPRAEVIVNRLQPELIRAGEMYTAQVVGQTLDLSVLGEVPEDPAVYRALLRHTSVMGLDCEAQRAITRIAARMTGENLPLPAYGTEKVSWMKRLFGRGVKEVKPIDC